jgi:alanine dehydrogenase
LKEGVNTYAGKLTYEAVAVAQGLEYTPLDDVLTGATAAA